MAPVGRFEPPELMSLPLGHLLVAIVGAVTVGFGLFQIYEALLCVARYGRILQPASPRICQ